ncbi:MAG: hypothetical protein N2234_08250 [Planctomycetota bacterium]|nr:hypothetical protein [Planctomycetota bacterium]
MSIYSFCSVKKVFATISNIICCDGDGEGHLRIAVVYKPQSAFILILLRKWELLFLLDLLAIVE